MGRAKGANKNIARSKPVCTYMSAHTYVYIHICICYIPRQTSIACRSVCIHRHRNGCACTHMSGILFGDTMVSNMSKIISSFWGYSILYKEHNLTRFNHQKNTTHMYTYFKSTHGLLVLCSRGPCRHHILLLMDEILHHLEALNYCTP